MRKDLTCRLTIKVKLCQAFEIFIYTKCKHHSWYHRSIDEEEVSFSHRVSPVQRCGGRRPRSAFVSAPRTRRCTPSRDKRVWCGLPGSGNCCGRVSLTSIGLQGRPESTPPPPQKGKKRISYMYVQIFKTSLQRILCLIRGVWIDMSCTAVTHCGSTGQQFLPGC